MSDTLLTLEGVHTHIGAYHILHGVDLVVPRGELTLLLGRNGAGKTTTLRTIMGLWQASQGRITFGGEDITQLNTPAIAQKNIAYVPENMGIFSDLTVKENMLLAARSAQHAAQMDEPSKGLAPAIIQNMIEAFQQLKASGVTILLVEQNIHFAQQLGDTVAVMDNGRVVHAGRMQALVEDTALQQSLLGLAL
jgi:branched-chain amino acid transport system ATP-binding protein